MPGSRANGASRLRVVGHQQHKDLISASNASTLELNLIVLEGIQLPADLKWLHAITLSLCQNYFKIGEHFHQVPIVMSDR